jgi:hypothetical protein
MNKPFLIRFWHGIPREDSAFMKKVTAICEKRQADENHLWDGDYFFRGTLQEFADGWKDKFIYLPAGDYDHIDGIICITQFGSFGQR